MCAKVVPATAKPAGKRTKVKNYRKISVQHTYLHNKSNIIPYLN